MNMLPNDPMMLISVVNTKLRDFYPSLDHLCEDMQVSKDEIIRKLSTIDYHYNKEQNQFL